MRKPAVYPFDLFSEKIARYYLGDFGSNLNSFHSLPNWGSSRDRKDCGYFLVYFHSGSSCN